MAERISSSISRVKIKKTSVKVPKLKVKKEKSIKPKKEDSFPISSIVNILIKSAIDKTKKERKEKVAVDEDKSYILKKGERELVVNGGYGTVSKEYGTAPHTSYIDYGKLFSYLGKFRAQSAYENMGDHVEFLNKSTESGSFTLTDRETMDNGARYVRHFHPKIPIDKTSLVPIAGMNSAEWEEFKRLMRFDTVMYLLKISTS